MTLRLTEAELARDLHTVLAKVQQGVEVVIEHDSRPVAVIKAPAVKGPEDLRGGRGIGSQRSKRRPR